MKYQCLMKRGEICDWEPCVYIPTCVYSSNPREGLGWDKWEHETLKEAQEYITKFLWPYGGENPEEFTIGFVFDLYGELYKIEEVDSD